MSSLVTAQPVHCLGDDHLKPAALSVLHQLLDPGPEQGRAGDCTVGIAVDNRPALPLGALAADAQLVLDRGVTLMLRGVAGVESDLHGRIERSGIVTVNRLVFFIDMIAGSLSR